MTKRPMPPVDSFAEDVRADEFRKAPPSSLLKDCRDYIRRKMVTARDYAQTEVDISVHFYPSTATGERLEIKPRVFSILKKELEERGFIVSDLILPFPQSFTNELGFTVSWNK